MDAEAELGWCRASENVAYSVSVPEVSWIVLQARVHGYRNIVVELVAFIRAAGRHAVVDGQVAQPARRIVFLPLLEELSACFLKGPRADSCSCHAWPPLICKSDVMMRQDGEDHG